MYKRRRGWNIDLLTKTQIEVFLRQLSIMSAKAGPHQVIPNLLDSGFRRNGGQKIEELEPLNSGVKVLSKTHAISTIRLPEA